ncbi:MAG: sulfatase-like hydrolase/transferase [Nitrospiraceae bacterium]|nr:sulfatase-like hydrolase/transferase [Nitrospiraceae bacterium]
MIVLDTVRADHVGCYGAQRPATPCIDRFASRATQYLRTFATSPWTIPTHASMFTGRYSFEHGAHAFRQLSETGRPIAKVRPLSEKHVTLAELLSQEGYATGAISANTNFKGRQVLQGFDTRLIERMYAPKTNEQIDNWLTSNARSPFFLFINYIDAHRPYNTTPIPGLIDEPVSQDKYLIKKLINLVLATDRPISSDLVRRVIDQYDTAIAHIDAAVGVLLAKLTALGLWDNTVIIITSDHGESFGEHRLAEHCLDVYAPEIRVPLLIKYPGQQQKKVVDSPISLVHLPRMILQALPEAMAERHAAQFPHAPGGAALLCENHLMGDRKREFNSKPYAKRFDRKRTALVQWPYKYIHSTKGITELYHLVEDPGELINRVADRPEVASKLVRKMDVFLNVRETGVKTDLDTTIPDRKLTPKEEQDLEALGYL